MLHSESTLQRRASHFITVNLRALHLAAAYSHGLVLYVAVCRTFWQYGVQVRVPLAAKAVVLPSGGGASLPVRLPITQPEGFQDSLAGLELLLLHQPATVGELGSSGQPGLWAEHSLLSLLGRTAALEERGGKAISCDLEPRAAFSWPAPGASVLHFTVQLHDSLQHEAAVELLQGVFQTHPPDPALGIPFPSLSIAQQQLSDDVRLDYGIHVRRAELPGTQGAAAAAGVAARRVGGPPGGDAGWAAAPGRGQLHGARPQAVAQGNSQQLQPEGQQLGQPQPEGQQLGQPQRQPELRKAVLVQQEGQQLELRRQQQQQIGWHPTDSVGAEQLEGLSPACRLTGLKRKHAALSRAPPAPHAERAQQGPVWVSLFSRDGQLRTEQQMQGFYCIVCDLRCRSFERVPHSLPPPALEATYMALSPPLSGQPAASHALPSCLQGLRQHLEASHDCFEYVFQEQAADGASELDMRCKPELYDESGDFLAGSELGGADANKHSMPTPQHSGMAAGLSVASLVSRGSGIEETEMEAAAAPPRRREAARAGAQPAHKQRQPPVKVHRKKQPLPKGKPTVAPRSGQGLTLLTAEGRPKFYHSRTCVPLTQQELLADDDSDDQSDDDEWARNCWQRLHQAAGDVPAAQRSFMFAWDQALRRNPLHADSDVPSWVQQFKAAQVAQGVGDDPAFHRTFAAMVTNLWRYRLLTPDQAYELLLWQQAPAADMQQQQHAHQQQQHVQQQDQQQDQQQHVQRQQEQDQSLQHHVMQVQQQQ
ncbi:hypothetical protein N2152v2_004425 [Parachlorella kessleri]